MNPVRLLPVQDYEQRMRAAYGFSTYSLSSGNAFLSDLFPLPFSTPITIDLALSGWFPFTLYDLEDASGGVLGATQHAGTVDLAARSTQLFSPSYTTRLLTAYFFSVIKLILILFGVIEGSLTTYILIKLGEYQNVTFSQRSFAYLIIFTGWWSVVHAGVLSAYLTPGYWICLLLPTYILWITGEAYFSQLLQGESFCPLAYSELLGSRGHVWFAHCREISAMLGVAWTAGTLYTILWIVLIVIYE